MPSGRALAAFLLIFVMLAGCASATSNSEPRARPHAAATTTSPSAVPDATTTPTVSPVPPADLSFAVIGDFGTGDAVQAAVANRMCRWRKRHAFDLVITTGDNVYPDGAPERFDTAFYRPYSCLFDAGVRFRATLGNHDVQTDGGAPELEDPAFGMRRRNYVVRRDGVRFVLVDSNLVDWDWLRAATRPAPTDRWTIVAFHHPVYSPGTGHGSTPGFRPKMPRLFRRRGVDLVLNGHDHIYAVSKPLRRIRYVVTGGGGAGLYGCTPRWFAERCEERHHFLWIVATTKSIRVQAVPASGRPFHRFTTTGRT